MVPFLSGVRSVPGRPDDAGPGCWHPREAAASDPQKTRKQREMRSNRLALRRASSHAARGGGEECDSGDGIDDLGEIGDLHTPTSDGLESRPGTEPPRREEARKEWERLGLWELVVPFLVSLVRRPPMACTPIEAAEKPRERLLGGSMHTTKAHILVHPVRPPSSRLFTPSLKVRGCLLHPLPCLLLVRVAAPRHSRPKDPARGIRILDPTQPLVQLSSFFPSR